MRLHIRPKKWISCSSPGADSWWRNFFFKENTHFFLFFGFPTLNILEMYLLNIFFGQCPGSPYEIRPYLSSLHSTVLVEHQYNIVQNSSFPSRHESYISNTNEFAVIDILHKTSTVQKIFISQTY